MREPCACGRQRCHTALPSSALLPLPPSPPLELLALTPLAPMPPHLPPPSLAPSLPLSWLPQALLLELLLLLQPPPMPLLLLAVVPLEAALLPGRGGIRDAF